MMKPVIVTIPLYKVEPNHQETQALIQTLSVLKQHPFSFFCPTGFDFRYYAAILQRYPVDYSIASFDPAFFTSLTGYSRLLLQESFYAHYAEYEYLLVTQLDVWIFDDQLLDWCAREYDYIGAPYLVDFRHEFYTGGTPEDYPDAGFEIGNGGCSLRRVATMRRILEQAGRSWAVLEDWSWIRQFYGDRFWRKLPQALWRYFSPDNILKFHLLHPVNEDYALCHHIRRHFPFRTPDPEDAASFAWETFPCWWEKKTGKTPFAWHAYLKYEPEFFRQKTRLD